MKEIRGKSWISEKKWGEKQSKSLLLPFFSRFSIFPLLSLFLLTSCLLVDDFGHAWEESKPDPCLSKIAQSLYYTEFRRDPEHKDLDEYAHGWSKDGFTYLLLKKSPDDKGGRLYRFLVQSGVYKQYRLNPVMRDSFTKNYPDAPITLDRDTVTIHKLDAASEKILSEVAGNEDYWEVDDQTLYNVYLNPLCRFEDRDLKALQMIQREKAQKK